MNFIDKREYRKDVNPLLTVATVSKRRENLVVAMNSREKWPSSRTNATSLLTQ